MTPALALSVVIPTRHRPEALAACLERLAPGAQTLSAEAYEVIVTDDGNPSAPSAFDTPDLSSRTAAYQAAPPPPNRPQFAPKHSRSSASDSADSSATAPSTTSSDGSSSAAATEALIRNRFPWARWTAGPRLGPAANRNHGASLATGATLVFLDDDCLPLPGILADYHRHFGSAPAGSALAAEGRISADRPPTRLDEEAPVNETGGHFWSCNIALRRDFFARLGGFDERFPDAAMEDVELRQRIRETGTVIAFLPDAAVIHPLRRLGGWPTLRRRAHAHGLYIRLESSHLLPFSLRLALRRFLFVWLRRILPQLWALRGRGLARRSQQSLLPFLCMIEMRRAARLPKLPVWRGPTP